MRPLVLQLFAIISHYPGLFSSVGNVIFFFPYDHGMQAHDETSYILSLNIFLGYTLEKQDFLDKENY